VVQDGGGTVGPDGAAAVPDQQEDPARRAFAPRARLALATAPRLRQAAARLEGATLRQPLEERQRYRRLCPYLPPLRMCSPSRAASPSSSSVTGRCGCASVTGRTPKVPTRLPLFSTLRPTSTQCLANHLGNEGQNRGSCAQARSAMLDSLQIISTVRP
jgi:hypothetical protein